MRRRYYDGMSDPAPNRPGSSMNEFYVTFDWNGLHYIGFVSATRRPECSQFANYEELHATMESLGHEWAMTCEMPHPLHFAIEETTVWAKQLALAIESIPVDPILGRRRGILE